MKNSYWNRNGELQAEYNEMRRAVENGTFTFTKTTENNFYRYYRYYNDGDLPGWARSAWWLTRQSRFGGRELNETGEAELELRITERIAAEWKRYSK